MDGKGTKKVPLPVDFHLKQAVGALTLHTGRNYMNSHGHKKCQRQSWRTHVACFKWKSLQRWDIFLKRTRNKAKIKRPRFPVAQHLNQAGRPLSSPHGGRGRTLYYRTGRHFLCRQTNHLDAPSAKKWTGKTADIRNNKYEVIISLIWIPLQKKSILNLPK